MLFNSFAFLIFLPTVFTLYWQLRKRAQNVLLLIASYVFYGWWDWRFLSLIWLTSSVDFAAARFIEATESASTRRRWLGASLAINLGVLGFFKYCNFFVGSAVTALDALGFQPDPFLLDVVLPVGISFYTFQSLSYTVDVYRRETAAEPSYVDFLAFVSFFPQLMAGPIERAGNLLPQFGSPRAFDPEAAADGCRRILWGFFKKIVIADNLGARVDAAYGMQGASGEQLALATIYFAIQIYCDFSGYSDIAIGTSRLFGFRLMENFRYPYFSRSVGEFWRRWHISLSTWFRDYVYVPLGGSRVSRGRYVRNVFVTFLVSGLWHGANWTFVVWGALHALFFLPGALMGSRAAKAPEEPRLRDLPQIVTTSLAVCVAWVFFRAESVTHGARVLERIATSTDVMRLLLANPREKALIAFFLVIEWARRREPHPLAGVRSPVWMRWAIYYGLIVTIALWGKFSYAAFIYFQF